MDPASPAVLLLPPRFRAPAAPQLAAAAELAGDRLLQEIAAAGLARVVDRAQLDRLLHERTLQAEPPRPMLSYDALIRMEVDAARLAPETRLSLIDLSNGNVLKEQGFRWPLEETDLPAILSLCRDALKGVKKEAVRKLRVRALWREEAIVNERIRPLGRRLIEVFSEALQRSERVVLVRHLEAATSKEESLLLLLGLSRLPGARQFTPQADAAIELRVVEGDGQGKTFPDTPVSIGVRLRKGADYQGDWLTTAGLVRDFDGLIPLAWRKLAQALGEVRAEAAATWLSEMSLRRKQAAAELQLVRQLEAGFLTMNVRVSQLEHAEAALKLDPTSPDAVRAYVNALSFVSLAQAISRGSAKTADAPHRTILEASRYLARFRPDGEVCSCLCESANRVVQFSSLYKLYGRRTDDELLRPIALHEVPWTPELERELDAAKQLLERGVDDDVRFCYDSVEQMTVVVYHGMRLFSKLPLDQRLKWLDGIHGRCARKIEAAAKQFAISPREDWRQFFRLQCRIAELFLEEGRTQQAKRTIVEAQSKCRGEYRYGLSPFLMRAVIKKSGDAQLAAEFERWLVGDKAKNAVVPRIEWPALDIFAGQGAAAPFNRFHPQQGPPLNVVEIRGKRPPGSRHYPRLRPLAEGAGRLYFLESPRHRIAYVPLDERGRPIGKATPNHYGTMIWDNVKDMPQPDLGGTREIALARFIDGKLLVGTDGSGLHVFDASTGHWKRYDPEHGLPASSVEECFPIGVQLLYCRSGNSHCTLNLANDAVTLLHRSKSGTEEYYGWALKHVWRNGPTLMALFRHGTWTDLLSKKPGRVPLSLTTCYGWRLKAPPHLGILGAAEVAGRRFYVCPGGLHEIDAAGNVIQSWWLRFPIDSVGNFGGVVAPRDCPLPDWPRFVLATGSRLVLADYQEITIYDVTTDMWYGPIHGAEWTLAVPSGGLWGKSVSGDGLIYLPLHDLEDYAKTVGRAMTSAEYRQRKRRFIDAAKPLDRGKFTLGMRQCDAAKAAFLQVLDAEPNHREALLLMGFLHDRHGLNQPNEAAKYYQRLAELNDNPR